MLIISILEMFTFNKSSNKESNESKGSHITNKIEPLVAMVAAK